MGTLLDRDILEQKLRGLNAESRLVFLEDALSTNTSALELISQKNAMPFVVVARNQTSGRGRMARKWFSSPNASIALSVAVEIDIDAAKTFTVRAGANICRALIAYAKVPFYVKWPNDIYTPNAKKIAGMLAELRPLADGRYAIIFGVGLNADFTGVDVPKELENTLADVAGYSGKEVDVNEIAALVVKGVEETANGKIALENGSFAACGDGYTFAKAFGDFDFLKNRRVCATVGNETFEGVACGIDSNARLIVRLDNNQTKCLNSGEAVLKKNFSV